MGTIYFGNHNLINIPVRAIQLNYYCTGGRRQHTTKAEQLPNNEECCARQTTPPTAPVNFVDFFNDKQQYIKKYISTN